MRISEDLKFTTAGEYMKGISNTIDLYQLEGVHTLDAVDFDTYEWDDLYYDVSNVIKFRLNGIVYAAIENPDDGYRSSMGDLVILKDNTMKNVFPPVKVVSTRGVDDRATLMFDVVETGKLVLEIGTNYMDDWYPCFVSFFDPTAMAAMV